MKSLPIYKIRALLGRTTLAGLGRNLLVAAVLAASGYAYAHMNTDRDGICFHSPKERMQTTDASRYVPVLFTPAGSFSKLVSY